MEVNKIDTVDGEIYLDLTADTVTADTLLQGVTAHDKSGAAITGTVVAHNVTVVSSKPTGSPGNVGDLFLVVKG